MMASFRPIVIFVLATVLLYASATAAMWLVFVPVVYLAAWVVPGVGYLLLALPLLQSWLLPGAVAAGVVIGLVDGSARPSPWATSGWSGVALSAGLAVGLVAVAGTAGRLLPWSPEYVEPGRLNWPGIMSAALVYGIVLLPVSLPVVLLVRRATARLAGRAKQGSP